MPVEEAAARPDAVAIDDIDDGAAGDPLGRFFGHLLKNPRMRRSTHDLEFDLRKGCAHTLFLCAHAAKPNSNQSICPRITPIPRIKSHLPYPWDQCYPWSNLFFLFSWKSGYYFI